MGRQPYPSGVRGQITAQPGLGRGVPGSQSRYLPCVSTSRAPGTRAALRGGPHTWRLLWVPSAGQREEWAPHPAPAVVLSFWQPGRVVRSTAQHVVAHVAPVMRTHVDLAWSRLGVEWRLLPPLLPSSLPQNSGALRMARRLLSLPLGERRSSLLGQPPCVPRAAKTFPPCDPEIPGMGPKGTSGPVHRDHIDGHSGSLVYRAEERWGQPSTHPGRRGSTRLGSRQLPKG